MDGYDTYRVEIFAGDFRDQKFRTTDMLTISGVAAALGVEVRTVHRMIRDDIFPASHIHKGRQAFWQRQSVRRWEKERLTKEKANARSRRYPSVDVIDREEQKDFALKPIDVQGAVRGTESMGWLLKDDPGEFARQHPNLVEWATKNGLLKR